MSEAPTARRFNYRRLAEMAGLEAEDRRRELPQDVAAGFMTMAEADDAIAAFEEIADILDWLADREIELTPGWGARLVTPRRLTWVEERAVGSKGSSSWVLMHGRQRVMLLVKLRWGGWYWSGLGHSGSRFANLTVYDAKEQAEAMAQRVLEQAERADVRAPAPSLFGGDG